MFQIGDSVRLSSGHTKMVVIGFDKCGSVIAKYANKWLPTNSDYFDPINASDIKIRPVSGFVKWNYMTDDINRYYSLRKKPNRIGLLLSYDSMGHAVLEMLDNKEIVKECESNLIRSHNYNYFLVSLVDHRFGINTNLTEMYSATKKINFKVGTFLVADADKCLYKVEKFIDDPKSWKGPYKGSFKGYVVSDERV